MGESTRSNGVEMDRARLIIRPTRLFKESIALQASHHGNWLPTYRFDWDPQG